MKVSQLLGERLRQSPSDCTTSNHIFMVRGGYIKQMSSGIYSLFTPGKRVCRKIEAIIREEMDMIDGQEVQFPVVMPATLWEESGRYTAIGSEMARLTDRSGAGLVLGMTHEEAAVHMARNTAQSYTAYPFMIYQIQTKFRDEPRCKGGMMRVREFTMKDAYSFHISQESLDEYYERALRSYHRVFARVGLPQVISVKSDSGMMGGSVAHEFMFLSDIGEDNIAVCPECGYSANVEASDCRVPAIEDIDAQLEKIATPGSTTIEDICALLHSCPENTCKAVVYQRNSDDRYVVAFIRGDREVNETKLRNTLGYEIHPATEITADSGIVAGFIGPVGLQADADILFDRTLAGRKNLICGANEKDFHMTGLNIERDLGEIAFVDVCKSADGDICPVCGKHSITVQKGVEAGNIFKLGDKYTKSMNMTYIDSDGVLKTPIMGCYGIGVGRLSACVLEQFHDDYGPVWPMTVAPWQVQICALSAAKSEAVQNTANGLYEALGKNGVEVLLDDRKMSNGAMFGDADLFGCPIRVVVSPRNCDNGVVEISLRDKSYKTDVSFADGDYSAVIAEIKRIIAEKTAEINALADQF